ncbi:MAG: hypothetical protein CMJ89_07590 [Planctomycetes bacterium]|nr:hypothetical protein [Planctomycetota bacterium]
MSKERSFERRLEHYRHLIQEDSALARELRSSREDFGPVPPGDSERVLYERRHLEWFLFDRPSESLDGVPVEALQTRWRDLAEEGDSNSDFSESFAGVFQVHSSRPGEGVRVHDLVGLGTYVVEERIAAAELAPGDLVVGRLFPLDAGVYRFSTAAAAFRNPGLVQALREDLEDMRRGRRGVLRIEQSELETLFFSGGGNALHGVQPASSWDAAQGALEVLRSAGIAPETCEEVLRAVREAGRAGDTETVNSILNHLAFETEVDLGELSQAFVQLSNAERSAESQSPPYAGESATQGMPAREALADFDEGLAAGRNLEDLFSTLERKLGVTADATDTSGEASLDGEAVHLGGVVVGVVEEFLWDVGREQGEAAARALEPLRLFAGYAEKIGTFEELGEKDLMDFSARWLLDESGVGPTEARAVLKALEFFCRWCEEQHFLPLWTDFGSALEVLQDSVPRMLELRETMPGDEPLSDGAYRVCGVHGMQAVLLELREDPELEKRTHIELTRPQAKHLQTDDLVRLTAAEPARIGACYPAEVAGFIES